MIMELEMFKDLSPAERKDMLDAQADEVTEELYLKPFDNDGAQKARERYCQLNLQLADIKAEEDEAKARFKEMRDPLKREADQILGNLKQGGVYVTGKLYKLIDKDERAVGFYNEDGDLVSQRKALPKEVMAQSIFGVVRMADKKNGTSDGNV